MIIGKYGTGIYDVSTYATPAYPGTPVWQDNRPSRGPFTVLPAVWLSDARRGRKEPLFPAYPYRARVTFNEDRLYKRDLTIDVLNPDTIRPKVDYLLVELFVTDADGRQATYQLGHFLVTEREITTTKTSRRGTLQGQEGTRVLGDSVTPVWVRMLADSDPGATARQWLGIYGIQPDMIDIPNAGMVTTSEIAWDAGETWLTILNDILSAGNMYHAWCSGDGRIRSRKYEDIAQARPVAHYGSHDGAFIVPPVKEDPDYGRLRNRVVVRKISPTEDPIVGIAEVTDASSPVHPQRLAEQRNSTYPVWLSETFDDPNIVDQDAAEARAQALLSEGASYYMPLTIETFVDDVIDGHQTVSLELRHGTTSYYTGNWRQRTWELRLEGAQATVRREVYRTEAWQ